MSSQGSNSNRAGRIFRRRVEQSVEGSGLPYRVEYRKYVDAQECVLRRDILLELPDGDRVIECKWHGTARGSIGQKLTYTAMWLSELPVPSIIVLGGYWDSKIVNRTRAHAPNKDRIMEEEQWKV